MQSSFPLPRGIAHTFTFTSVQLNWTLLPSLVWEIKHAACTWLPFLCLPCVRVREEVPAPNALHSHFLCFLSSAPTHLLLPRLSVCLVLVSSGLTDTNSKVSVEMDPGLFDLAVLFFFSSPPFWRWVLLPLSALASLFLFLFLPKLLGWNPEILRWCRREREGKRGWSSYEGVGKKRENTLEDWGINFQYKLWRIPRMARFSITSCSLSLFPSLRFILMISSLPADATEESLSWALILPCFY